MKQLKFMKQDPSMGDIEGLMRIDKKICFFKYNQSDQAQAMMQNLQAKGAIIAPGRKWIRVNLFGENKEVKLGDEQFNIDEKSNNEVSDILIKFFAEKYAQAGFICEIKDVK